MVRGITVCVQYDDLLKVVLPFNLRNLDELWIVTSPADEGTQQLAAQYPQVKLHVTDAFYRHGAIFNKGMAMEEGFEAMGRTGWIMIFDADTLIPTKVDWGFLKVGNMYTPERHMLTNPADWYDGMEWRKLPVKREYEWAGYCQVFSAEDPRLVSKRPWYGINWPHAGGCDSDFQQIWPGEQKLRPNFRAVHLGEDCRNWCGRVSKRLDGVEYSELVKRMEVMNRVRNDWPFRLQRLVIPAGH